MQRLPRNLLIAAVLAAAAMLASIGEPPGRTERLSLLSAWACFALLAIAMLIGPRHVDSAGRPLLNDLTRRDLGIWAGVTGLLHLVLGSMVSMQPAYFLAHLGERPEFPPTKPWQHVFSWSTMAGLVVGLLLILLLAISNNATLRWLGPVRWKRLQRVAYVVFFATAAHGISFQLLESRTGAWLATLLLVTGVVAAAQTRAFLRMRDNRLT